MNNDTGTPIMFQDRLEPELDLIVDLLFSKEKTRCQHARERLERLDDGDHAMAVWHMCQHRSSLAATNEERLESIRHCHAWVADLVLAALGLGNDPSIDAVMRRRREETK